MTPHSPVPLGRYHATCRRTAGWSTILFLLLAGTCLAVDGIGTPGVYFAEPVSGRKVTSYTVELHVSRDEVRPLHVPADCPQVLQLIDAGSIYRSGVVERRVWHKVESDCRYHAFLHRHPRPVIEDYVTGYDFMNADLHDLPIDQRCVSGDHDSGPDGCNPAVTDVTGLLRFFPLAEPPGGSGSDTTASCELRDGLFRGRLFVDQHGIYCERGTQRPSLRLIAVDFADVNGDEVMDAVLRFIPLGPGAVRSPLVLPLTRFAADERFQVPQQPGQAAAMPAAQD